MGCRPKPQYPGFTKIAETRSESYFIDANTISHGSGIDFVVASQLIQYADSTHSIGTILVNCATKVSKAGESTRYDRSGNVLEPLKEHLQLELVVSEYLCVKLASLPIISGEFSEDAAITGVLGRKGNVWKPQIPASLNINADTDQLFKAAVVLNKEYVEKGQTKRLLVLSSVPNEGDYSCHACGVLISAFVFRKDSNGWFVDSENPYLVVAGSFGTSPEAALAKIGPDRYGFNLKSDYGGQGEEVENTAFYGTIERSIAELLNVNDYNGDSGGVFNDSPATEDKTLIQWGPQTVNGYYEVHLSTKGTKLNESMAVIPIESEQTCKMTGAKYSCK